MIDSFVVFIGDDGLIYIDFEEVVWVVLFGGMIVQGFMMLFYFIGFVKLLSILQDGLVYCLNYGFDCVCIIMFVFVDLCICGCFIIDQFED